MNGKCQPHLAQRGPQKMKGLSVPNCVTLRYGTIPLGKQDSMGGFSARDPGPLPSTPHSLLYR